MGQAAEKADVSTLVDIRALDRFQRQKASEEMMRRQRVAINALGDANKSVHQCDEDLISGVRITFHKVKVIDTAKTTDEENPAFVEVLHIRRRWREKAGEGGGSMNYDHTDVVTEWHEKRYARQLAEYREGLENGEPLKRIVKDADQREAFEHRNIHTIEALASVNPVDLPSGLRHYHPRAVAYVEGLKRKATMTALLAEIKADPASKELLREALAEEKGD